MPAAIVAGSSQVWLNTGYVATTATVAANATRAVATRHRPRVIANERVEALTPRLRSACLCDRLGERRVCSLGQCVELQVSIGNLAVLTDHVDGTVGNGPADAARAVQRRRGELRVGDEREGELHLRRPRDVARDAVGGDGQYDDILPEQRGVLIAEPRQLGSAAAGAILGIEGQDDDLSLEAGELDGRRAGAGRVSPGSGEVGRELTDVGPVDDYGRSGIGRLGTSSHGSGKQRRRGETVKNAKRTHRRSWKGYVGTTIVGRR